MTTVKDQAPQDKNGPGKLLTLAAKAGLDGFLPALIFMILLAYIWPAPGAYKGTWSLENIASFGVSLIFFFYGLRLSPEKLKAGLRNWKLHITVHTTTFILFPVLILAARSALPAGNDPLLWLGIFFLASLPSTVSSAVVMVSIAGGNIPAAIFNASISSLIGVFITPLWMGLFLKTSSGSFDLTSIIIKLSLQVLLPVVLGILLHGKWGAFAERHKKRLRMFDQSIILLIIYTSFCHSFKLNMFKDFSLVDLILLGGGMIGLFLLVYGIVTLVCRLMNFNREDRITAVFCSSKKSLVHGTVMSKVLFSGSDVSGIILLPLMLYHALQLIASSIIAQAIARKQEGEK